MVTPHPQQNHLLAACPQRTTSASPDWSDSDPLGGAVYESGGKLGIYSHHQLVS